MKCCFGFYVVQNFKIKKISEKLIKMFSKKLGIFTILLFLFVSSTLVLSDDFDDEDTFEEEIIKEVPAEPKEKYTPPLYTSPKIDASKVNFLELFDDKKAIGKKWFKSESKKEGAEEAISKYDGEWSIDAPSDVLIEGDYGLIVRSKARHHAIAAKLQKPFKFDGSPFILQYEVQYQEGQECGGGYLKLLESKVGEDLKNFNDKSPYVIMFGPDKCGMNSKVHFIVRHRNPKNGTVSEHHAKQSNKQLSTYFEDRKAHLYTLAISPDNSFKVSVDGSELMAGNMLTDLDPPIVPPKQIPDPEDKKPSDWDDRAQIEDPDATKPADWDETQPKEVLDEAAQKPGDWLEEEEPLIADKSAEKPEDWDDEMDGEWEPRKVPNPKCEGVSGCGQWTRPMKANPLYKGKWTPPRISNPNYKGPWSARLIDNPHFFEGIQLEPIAAVGIELWTMSSGIVFDNIIVTADAETAQSLAKQTFDAKKAQEKAFQAASGDSKNIFKSVLEATEEKLWAVIILAVLLPIVLVAVLCFGRKSSEQRKAADHKKTDEPVEDEEEIVEMDDATEEQQQDEEELAQPDQEGNAKEQHSASSSPGSSKPPTPGPEQVPAASEEPPVPAENVSPRPRRVRARRQD